MRKKEQEPKFMAAVILKRTKDGSLEYKDFQELKLDDVITTDNDIILIRDNKGNILSEINKREMKNKNQLTTCISIDYLKDSNIVYTEFNNLRPLKTTYINNAKNHKMKREIFDCNKGGMLMDIEIPKENSDSIIITRKYKDKRESRLFSTKTGRFISPLVTRFSKTENENILRFDDDVESNKIENGRKHYTTLTGYITLNGTMTNYVYDHELNKTREIGFKSGKLMEGYKKFRNKVKNELDYLFEEEKQIAKRKESFENNSIKQLKLRVKN